MVDWNELVRSEGPAVWRTIYRLVQNRADADECLQETFAAAVAYSQRHQVAHWPALLKRLAVVRAMDCLRKQVRRRRHELRSDVAEQTAARRVPAESVESAELATQLRAALTRIKPRAAQILCLHELEGWSYQEIADHLSLTVNAVGVEIHRAKQRLRHLLAEVQETRT